MPNKKIFVWSRGGYDPTRWLAVELRTPESCVLHLSDLCLPGKVSSMIQVGCPVGYFQTSITHGAIQITLPDGYLLLQHESDGSDGIILEFRGSDDTQPTRASFLAKDLKAFFNSEEFITDGFAMSRTS